MRKSLKLSIIIPAFNEEDHLRECLNAIARQTVKPFEVFVVNNNSTDGTCEVAKSYNFVTLLHEKTQGLIPARNCGFEAASGDILARLDADSVLSENWVELVQSLFEKQSVMAVTGPAISFIDPHFPSLRSMFWSRLYFWQSKAVFRFQVLWGPNMAIRKTLWEKIKGEACLEDSLVHEDQDLSILVRKHGHSILYCPDLRISVDGERAAYLPKVLEYRARQSKTLNRHKRFGNLAAARKGDSMNFVKSKLILFSLMPAGLLFGVSSGIYTLEKLLKLR